MTLPQIKAFLAENGLQFTGFVLDPATQQQFAARFPETAALLDLDHWHAFETAAPATFAKMYQFLVRKTERPGSATDFRNVARGAIGPAA